MRGKSTARILQDSTDLVKQRTTGMPPFNANNEFGATTSNGSETRPLQTVEFTDDP